VTYQLQTNLPSLVGFSYPAYTVLSGASLLVTAWVESASFSPAYEPNYPVATGTVQLLLDGKSIGSPVSLTATGAASLSVPTAGLAIGSHTIGLSYSGDGTYVASVSYTGTFGVVVPDFSLQAFSNTVGAVNGNTTGPVGLQVSDMYGFAGAVTFSCSGLPRGTNCNFSQNPLNGNGSVSLTITTTKASAVFGSPSSEDVRRPFAGWMGLTGGALSACLIGVLIPGRSRRNLQLYIAVFVSLALATLTSCGSGTAGGGTSSGAKVFTTTSLSQSNSAPSEGANDTITASISSTSNNSPTPTGTVQFVVDSSLVGSGVTVSAATASFSTSFATPGIHTVSAAYSGDNSYFASNSGGVQVSVPYASGTAPGNYNINVTGTSGSLSHTVTMYLDVQ
jgi:hypothetical protein